MLRLALLLCVGLALPGYGAARLEFSYGAPDRVPRGEVLKVDGALSGDVQLLEKVVLHYRAPGDEWTEVRMELQYGDLYRGVVPAARMVPPAIELYVEAVLQGGERLPALGSAKKPVRIAVGADGEGDAEARAPGKKGKKKKGKKGDVEPEPEVAAKEPEVKPFDDPPVEEPAKKDPEPPRAETKVARVEPKAEPRSESRAEPARSEPPRRRSELEEELAIYAAEDTSGVVMRISESSKKSLQVTTLTADDARQRGARTVADALDLVSGLTVSRDVQGFYRLAVRGLRGDAEVLFTIDGHPVNPLYDGKALWNLPVANLARIEVARGPGLEPGAFLARVNLVTNRQDGLRALASAGLFQAFDGHLSGAHHFGALQLFVDADVASQKGQSRPVTKDSLDANTIAQNKRQPGDPAGVVNDARLLVNVGGGAAYESEKVGTLSLSGRFILESRGALVGQFDTLGPDSHLNSSALLVDLAYRKPIGASEVSVRAWFDQHTTSRNFQLSPTDYLVKTGADPFPEGIREQLDVASRSFGLEAKGSFSLPAKNRLEALLRGGYSGLSNFAYTTNYEPSATTYQGPALKRPAGLVYPTEAGGGAAARRVSVSGFVGDTFTPVDKLSLNAGLLVELATVPTGPSGGQVTGSRLAAGVSPRAGLVFSPVESLALRASYTRGFRVGTVQEYADTLPDSDNNQGRPVGNPALATPTIDSVELGFEYVQQVGDARVVVGGLGYFENVSNPIVAVDPSGNLFPFSNRPQGVRVLGLEGEARLELSRRAAAWVNASFSRAEDLGTVSTARLLTDTPQARFNAGLSLPLGPYLAFDATVRVGAERQNDARSVLELIRRYQLPAYAIVGAQLRTEPLFDHLELGLSVQNAFNFQLADDVPRPDRITPGVPREGATGFLYARLDL